jgi:hypothetical protein
MVEPPGGGFALEKQNPPTYRFDYFMGIFLTVYTDKDMKS